MQDLRVWLELEIPLIEDGNSFGKPRPHTLDDWSADVCLGAEVQNHLIRELETVYKKSNNFINSARSHHTDRIRLASEWIKTPNVMVG